MSAKALHAVIRTARHYDMLRPGDSVLAAVSGGPDSVFLARILCRVRTTFSLSRLTVCHLDHGIRGRESAADALFVRQLAAELGLPCIWRRVRVLRTRRRGRSLEETAREVRYRFYRDAARLCGAGVVATGHTLDDQAETVLMRVIKGASLKGAAGIAPVREDGGLRYIRPLFSLEKKEIVSVLGHESQAYQRDRTNDDPAHFRNVVRGEIMPFLERYNPRVKRALSHLAEHLRDDLRFIEEAKRAGRGMALNRHGSVELPLAVIVTQPKALQKEILRDALDHAGGCVKKLSFSHWKDVELLITRMGKGSAVDLPGGIRISRTSRSLTFRRCGR